MYTKNKKNTSNFGNPCEFLSTSPLEIARQLTLMDSELFRKIHHTEFLNSAWSSKKAQAPNIAMFTERFNRVCDFQKKILL